MFVVKRMLEYKQKIKRKSVCFYVYTHPNAGIGRQDELKLR